MWAVNECVRAEGKKWKCEMSTELSKKQQTSGEKHPSTSTNSKAHERQRDRQGRKVQRVRDSEKKDEELES